MAELKAGTHLKVFIPLDGENGRTIMLSSILKGFDNNRLLIIVPVKSQAECPVDVKHKVIIECYEKNIAFDATVLRRYTMGTWCYFLLEQDSGCRYIQQRQDFRLDCMLDGYAEFRGIDGGVRTINITTLDISGGGACIYSPIALNSGEIVNAYLPLGYNNEFIFFPCKVRRCVYLENSGPLNHVAGLQFLFENDKQKDWLIGQIFKMQLERRKLG